MNFACRLHRHFFSTPRLRLIGLGPDLACFVNIRGKHTLQQRHLARAHQFGNHASQVVAVLFKEIGSIVLDLSSKVLNPKRREVARLVGFAIERVIFEVAIELVNECLVGSFGKVRLFVQQGQDADGFSQKHIDQCQVIPKCDFVHVDAFFLVLFKLDFEGVAIEKVLQLFVRQVDAYLLKGICLKVFEPENVKDLIDWDIAYNVGRLTEIETK